MKITSLYFSFMFCTILVFSPFAIGENDLSNEHGDLVLNEPDVDMLNDSTAAATTITSTQPVADTNNLRAYGTEFSGLTRKQRGSSHNRRLQSGKGSSGGKGMSGATTGGKGSSGIKIPGFSMMSSLVCPVCPTNTFCQVGATGAVAPACAACTAPACLAGAICYNAALVPVNPCLATPSICLGGGTCIPTREACPAGTCCPTGEFRCDCVYPLGGKNCEIQACAAPVDPCVGGGGKGKGSSLKTQCAIDAKGKQSCVCPACQTGKNCNEGLVLNPCGTTPATNPCLSELFKTTCVPLVLSVGTGGVQNAECFTKDFECVAPLPAR